MEKKSENKPDAPIHCYNYMDIVKPVFTTLNKKY